MTMSDFPELEELSSQPAAVVAPGMPDLRRLGDVPVEVRAEIGRAQMTVNAVLDLRNGSIVTLDRMAGEPVDLLVNGTLVAHGEVVVIDEQFGVRVSGVDGRVEAEPEPVLDASVDAAEAETA